MPNQSFHVIGAQSTYATKIDSLTVKYVTINYTLNVTLLTIDVTTPVLIICA
jgi:hypothetical protein